MARRERPLDPAADLVAGFAELLRELRRTAGSPSYRTLAARAHYAPTTLSEAAAGRRLPSLPVTLAYVRACGGDADEWHRRWQSVAEAAGSHGGREPVDPSIPASEPVEAAETPATADAVAAPRLPHTPFWRRRPRRVAAGILLVTIALVAVVAAQSSQGTDTGRSTNEPGARTVPDATGSRSPSAPAVSDGADPKQAGCATDGVTLAATPVRDSRALMYGAVELRYSAHCRAAWTRYLPAPGTPSPTTVTVMLTRPRPLGRATFTIDVTDGAIFGDVLLFAQGCVQASAIVAVNGQQVATAETPCVAEPPAT